MKRHMMILALSAAVAAPSAFAVTEAQLKALANALSSVPAPELPAKAAEVVKQAPPTERASIAIAAVQAAIAQNRASAPLVVSAISKAAPEVAAVSRAAAIAADPGKNSGKDDGKGNGNGNSGNGNGNGNGNSGNGNGNGNGNSGPGSVKHDNKPINQNNGNGRFPTSPPHGGNPPGHDPDHHGKPDFVDYSKPRRM
jgi:hypothetical protein